MLDQSLRNAILKLHGAHNGVRAISRALKISRGAVRDVLASGDEVPPAIERPEKAGPYHDLIVALYVDCKGNLVRVHEELLGRGAQLSYPSLTAYCRRHGIDRSPPLPAGQYHFEPGEEMQHDTSPHHAWIGGILRPAQTASLVFCFSRRLFFQMYPTFTRFDCKVFLTDAFEYFGGVCARCMIDNTGVIVLHGTGVDMVPVPEMAVFAERYRFTFVAHEKGDANRSARVEGPFHYIEHNFLAGRRFLDWAELNREALVWCDKVNAAFSRKLHASRLELFAMERARLRPLPIWVPDVYVLHHRIVDLEGYVTVRGHRYSAPYTLIGRMLEAREAKNTIQLFDGSRLVWTHARSTDPRGRTTIEAHRPPRGQRKPPPGPTLEERDLLAIAPELAAFVDGLKKRSHGRGTIALRQLCRMLREYPRETALRALLEAAHFGLYDLDRVERMILRNIDREFFPNAYDGDEEEPSDE